MLCSLEDQHIVERARNTERHSVTEGSLTEGVYKKHGGCCCHRSAVSNEDQGRMPSHSPVPTPVPCNRDTNEEMEHNELVRTAVVEPFVERTGFPDGYRWAIAFELGTTAPEMMLLPHISEPDTGSRMPSMSTGGAATKAVMKQIVAASNVGIESTPNQPT